MIRIQDEIAIAADPAEVWATFVDFERYAIWNPFIRRVSAPVFAPGEQIDADLQPSGQRSVPIYPRILVIRPPRELRWRSHILHRYVLYGEHTFLLQPIETGTLFFQRLELGGLLARPIAMIIASDTRRGIEEMNAALKVHVEHTGAGASPNTPNTQRAKNTNAAQSATQEQEHPRT